MKKKETMKWTYSRVTSGQLNPLSRWVLTGILLNNSQHDSAASPFEGSKELPLAHPFT
jgi:hypothetical protein